MTQAISFKQGFLAALAALVFRVQGPGLAGPFSKTLVSLTSPQPPSIRPSWLLYLVCTWLQWWAGP
ncbi:MAG: hypothetical protein ACN6OR_00230 [Stenotrophomonas sp.]